MPAVQFILSSRVAKEKLGTANGVNDAAGALARVIAPLCIGTLYRSGLAWRVSSMLPASALPLLFAVVPAASRSRHDDTTTAGAPDGMLQIPLHESRKANEYQTVSQFEDSTVRSVDRKATPPFGYLADKNRR